MVPIAHQNDREGGRHVPMDVATLPVVPSSNLTSHAIGLIFVV